MRTVSRRFPLRPLAAGLLVASLALVVHLAAQGRSGGPPPGPTINQPDDALLRGFRWRSIGPVGQGARVDDFAVDEKNPSTYYIGFAVSGVWKTTNNGVTFDPILTDAQVGTASIGDLALAPSDPNVLYVGTGEANNRQTSTFGSGLWKSTDAGKTFAYMGLKEVQSIARIVVHPKDPNTLWVAADGHLYGPNPERGVYMSTDGGKTFDQVLKVDENTGATDLIIDPANPKNLWAATYERRRAEWGFVGGGPGSGLWASIDGGKTWKRQTGNGLPHGTMGRIGLDICRTNPNVLYAQIEVAEDKEPPGQPPAAAPAPTGGAGAAGGGQGRGRAAGPPNPQTSGVWKSVDHGKTWQFVSNQDPRPMYFSQIRVDPNDANTLYIGGVAPTKSTDGGRTWQGLNNMGHVDNHAIWIDPLNSRHVMYGNDGGVDITWDAGDTWASPRLWSVGLAYHASADMRHPYWVCTGLQDNGSWCGPSSVRSTQGIRHWDWISVGGGDGFQNAMDPTDFHIFYTESQNAGIERYDTTTGETRGIAPRDTMNDPSCGGRGGRGGGRGAQPPNVTPTPPPCTNFVFNWNSPFILSPDNPSTIVLGGNRLFISRDRGDTWTMTEPLGKGVDLTKREMLGQSYALPGCGRGAGPGQPCILSKHDGYAPDEYGTITEVAESPLVPGILWAGTDDGNVQVSKDGGHTWTEVGQNVPGVDHEYYVSGLEASYFDAGTAYLALDGHRDDDLKPYVFKTTDYGQTWTSIAGTLPARGNVNSIRQDPVNPNLLFAPTEFGFFVTLDEGKSWHAFMPNLPVGRMDEVMVHPRDHDLILSSHGFAVWIMDDITALEQMTPGALASDAALFQPRDAVLWKNDVRQRTEVPGDQFWQGENAPRGTAIAFTVKSGGEATITITNTATGEPIRHETLTAQAGLNRWQWNLAGDPPLGQAGGAGGGGGGRGGLGGRGAQPGVYRVSVSVGGHEIGSKTFNVLEDVWLNER